MAIPGLVGPMLGPIAGGLIVGYFHWRVIFFVNIPIGLMGLDLVYRHLPDYREARTPPLDVGGLLLFGSGVGLLSYVLEVFGEHTLSGSRNCRDAGWFRWCCWRLMDFARRAPQFPLLRLSLFRIRTFRSVVSGEFFDAIGD